MIWIVATTSLFGYAAAASDVQVTWPGGRHLDCLQKVYPAIPIVAFGFSGSVRIGFHLLEDFRRNCLRGLPEGQARPVRICAHDWYRRARWIFKRLPPDERELGSSIILLGVPPQERPGAALFPRTDVVVMESRSAFVPCYVKRLECVKIGSGNDVNEYVKEIELRNRSGAGVFVNAPQAVRDFGADGHLIDDPAPYIARSWPDFYALARSQGLPAAGAAA